MAAKPHPQYPHKTWSIRCSIHYLIAVLMTAILASAVFLTGKGRGGYLSEDHCGGLSALNIVNEPLTEEIKECDLFDGKWAFDDESYPLYNERECSFMSDQLACEKYGRKDLSYQNWRWQPHHCDMPRFNATALLERLRNKRMVFVGDSLNRGQWVSMVCLVERSIPSHLKKMDTNGSLITFRAIDYNATVEFYWAPLLVESNSDDPINHNLPERIVRIQAIEKHARHWTNAHIIVFDTYLWWMRPKMKVLWGSFENPDAGIYKDVEMPRAYELALQTWADWGEEWGGRAGQNCFNETSPVAKAKYWGTGSETKLMRIVENTISSLKHRGLNIQMLNITQLSEYRKEAHPSIYRKQWEPLRKDQLSDPSSYADSSTVLYIERSIQRFNPEPDGSRNERHTFVKSIPRSRDVGNRTAKQLDRYSKCSATVEYSGRKAEWGGANKLTFDYRRKRAECDLFSGKWVYDNGSYPLYDEAKCPYMSDQLACHKHGRMDLDYQRWRWQPHGCELNRWNIMEMWEKLRGKRLMFVGDSLNRGQWISMVCLLQSVIPANKQSMTPNAELTIFKAEDYNATVEFLWAPLLVESNSDDPVNHRLDERIMRPDSLLRHSSRWQNADILVFNTYLWWRQGPVKLLWRDEEDSVCEELDGNRAMELAMEAWAEWVATNIDPAKKKVFFVTMSPTHFWSREWAPESEGNCYNEKTPIEVEGHWGGGSDISTMRMLDRVLGQLSSKVSVLNITQLSEYRKDGHPSIYRKFWEALSPEQLSNPSTYSDCIHWCLPGVPDVWNELLFHML
ncbi:unnamed protein product [Rhodiola kirilowii]